MNKGEYTYSFGKRKTAVATVRIYDEKGDTIINEKTIKDYFNDSILEDTALESLNLFKLVGKTRLTIKVKGGGKKSQAEAIRLGISRCLLKIDPENRKTLRSKGFLTRDPRVKERKKPGLRGARRAPQWSKR
ncbi:30S ribosomal protein S9 [bacterium]|nr:30S ribosomal protein S9 [bacterium]